MQITVLTLNWSEVEKRSSPEQILEEMIHTDDIDIYAKELPDGLWISDSATQHFQTAELLANSAKKDPQDKVLKEVCSLIAYGDSIDELSLSPMTDGAYFISISPSRIEKLLPAFRDYSSRASLPADSKQWIDQWKPALEFAASKDLGLIGICG